MTNSPDNLKAVRYIYQRHTGLAAVALGIQHYSPQGGGYHEGDDLLAAGNRLTQDYSKRESSLDRDNRVDPNDACAIDIGYFDVEITRFDGTRRRVTLRDRSAWVLAHWDEAPFIRELIYSPDGKVVKRKDRLGIRTSGDSSHLTHDHESYFRSMVRDPRIPAFHLRFWDDMYGITETNVSAVRGAKDLFSCVFKGDPAKAIYISDGFKYRHIKSWPAFQKLYGASVVNQNPIEFDSKDEMEIAAGKAETEGV